MLHAKVIVSLTVLVSYFALVFFLAGAAAGRGGLRILLFPAALRFPIHHRELLLVLRRQVGDVLAQLIALGGVHAHGFRELIAGRGILILARALRPAIAAATRLPGAGNTRPAPPSVSPAASPECERSDPDSPAPAARLATARHKPSGAPCSHPCLGSQLRQHRLQLAPPARPARRHFWKHPRMRERWEPLAPTDEDRNQREEQ